LYDLKGGHLALLFFVPYYMPKRSTEIKKLDKALSQYVRFSNADVNGNVSCFTCQKKVDWKYECDCGHFQSRAKYSTRWLYDPENGLTNVQPQCKHCNLTNGGQQWLFGKRLDAVYGEGTAMKILQMSNTTRKFSTQEIIELRKEYVQKFNDLRT
jgi:hypothetical protein